MSRPYDMVVYGATGYTGSITCEYIASKRKGEKIAISGRSKQKLEELKQEMVKINPANEDIGIIVCDATNGQDIKSMVSQATICISFVGPYRIFGEPILRACVEAGTDYVDSTGEPPFFNEMADKYHEAAATKKLFLLPASGVFSMIPDIAVEIVKESYVKDGSHAQSAKGYFKFNGRHAKTWSNGTWGTFLNSMISKPPRRPQSKSTTPKLQTPRAGLHRYAVNNTWAVPFVEGADLHVVRRTNELTIGKAGIETFGYAQFMQIPLIPPLYTIITILSVLILMYLSKIPFIRKWLLARKFPGGGPSKEERRDSTVEFFCDAVGENKKKKHLHMKMPCGPYDVTGACCAEAAFALLHDRNSFDTVYGVVTPAAAASAILQKRLRERIHVSWDITDL